MADETLTPPDDLPAAELGLLAAYREQRKMPSAAKARVGQRLGSNTTAHARSRSRPRAVVVAAVAVAALALAAWGLSRLRADATQTSVQDAANQALLEADSSEPLQAHEGVATPEARRPAPLRPGPATEPQPPAVEVEPPASPAVEKAPPPAKRPKRAKREVQGSAPEPAPAPSALSQEREILSKAWAALARGDHAAALSQTSAHAERFPSGTLKVERLAIATIAGCKAKQVGWSKQAASFLSRHGKTPLARRVREACEPATQ